MNPTTPSNYDIWWHNESAAWRNQMWNLGLTWSPREKAMAYRWWNENRPHDSQWGLILDGFTAPNGYSPLLWIEWGSDYMGTHAILAKERTQKAVQDLLMEVSLKIERLKKLRSVLDFHKSELPWLLNLLWVEKSLPQSQILDIVIPNVVEYIQAIEDNEHKQACLEYLELFFLIHSDRRTVLLWDILAKHGITSESLKTL